MVYVQGSITGRQGILAGEEGYRCSDGDAFAMEGTRHRTFSPTSRKAFTFIIHTFNQKTSWYTRRRGRRGAETETAAKLARNRSICILAQQRSSVIRTTTHVTCAQLGVHVLYLALEMGLFSCKSRCSCYYRHTMIEKRCKITAKHINDNSSACEHEHHDHRTSWALPALGQQSAVTYHR